MLILRWLLLFPLFFFFYESNFDFAWFSAHFVPWTTSTVSLPWTSYVPSTSLTFLTVTHVFNCFSSLSGFSYILWRWNSWGGGFIDTFSTFFYSLSGLQYFCYITFKKIFFGQKSLTYLTMCVICFPAL